MTTGACIILIHMCEFTRINRLECVANDTNMMKFTLPHTFHSSFYADHVTNAVRFLVYSAAVFQLCFEF